MEPRDREDLVPDPVTQAGGEEGGPVLSAFAGTDVDARRGEVNVLDAQRHAFGDAKARAVKELGEELGRALKCAKESANLLNGQHHRKTRQTLYPTKSFQMADVKLKDVPVKEEDCVQRLRLRRGGDLALGRERVDEWRYAGRTDVSWMSALVEVDVLPDPEAIRLFGSPAEMAAATHGGNDFQEPRGWGVLTP